MSSITSEDAVAHAFTYFGLVIEKVKSLGSCQDINFKVDATNGLSFVAKYANPETKFEEIDFQVKVLKFLDDQADGLDLHFPRPVPLLQTFATDEALSPFIVQVEVAGIKRYFYLLSFIHGSLLADFKTYLSHDTLFHFGREIARFNSILKAFPEVNKISRSCEWDPKLSFEMCTQRLQAVADEQLRAELTTCLTEMNGIVVDASVNLREQLVHCDLAHYNVVANRGENGRPYVSGIIDFGDVTTTWLVGDLAVAITPLLIHNDRPSLDYVMSIIQGYVSITPLTESEVRALWPLIVMRGVLLYVSVTFLLLDDPHNTYLQEEVSLNYEVMQKLLAINPNFAESAVRTATGSRILAESEDCLSLFDTNNVEVRLVDLSSTSALYRDGNWNDQDGVEELIAEAFHNESFVVEVERKKKARQFDDDERKVLDRDTIFTVPPGSSWFMRSVHRALVSPKTIATFSLSMCPPRTAMRAPFSGKLVSLDVQSFVQQHWKKKDLPAMVFNTDKCRLYQLRSEERDVIIAGNIECEERDVVQGMAWSPFLASNSEFDLIVGPVDC
jgi:Ser/Thr protein kinase RdoA (MazF antagonist)